MQESLPSEHGSELFSNSLEQFLDGSWVSNEGGGHFETSWRDVANSSLDVIWDPFNEVRGVLVLDVQKLFINFLHGHSSSEDASNSKVATMARITCSHHVASIEHLLGQFGDCKRSGREKLRFLFSWSLCTWMMVNIDVFKLVGEVMNCFMTFQTKSWKKTDVLPYLGALIFFVTKN